MDLGNDEAGLKEEEMATSFEHLWQSVNSLWAVFVVYNVFNLRKIRVKRALPTPRITIEGCGIAVAALLIFFPRMHPGLLAVRFHKSFVLEVAGFCITVAGLAFAAWARDVLGRNWSARPVIQVDQRLVIAGPYAYLRHPLYSGLLIAFAGTALACGDYGGLLGWIMALAYFCSKAHREEYLLQMEFGSSYSDYRARTGFLFPRLAHV
jgi:protein-S-isoprenylcysteine O-methyltransferase Ste14